jgi:hypothetical protein
MTTCHEASTVRDLIKSLKKVLSAIKGKKRQAKTRTSSSKKHRADEEDKQSESECGAK